MIYKTFLTLVFSLISICIYGQSLSLSVGKITHSDEVIVAMINPKTLRNPKPIKGFNLTIPATKKLQIGVSYSRFSGWNHIGSTGEVGGFGRGSSRVLLKRYGLMFQYKLNINKGRITFLPSIEMSLEKNLPQQPEGLIMTNIFDGSGTRGLYMGFAEVQAFSGQQILPTLGIGFSFNIIGGLNFIVDYRWSFGHRVFQEMFVNYTYNDIPQPTAYVVNKGSGFIRTFGVSYDLGLMKPIIK